MKRNVGIEYRSQHHRGRTVPDLSRTQAMNYDKVLWETSKVFAPDFPRQCSDDETFQAQRATRSAFAAALKNAGENGMPGYYSVYSFPRGHSKDGNIPKVDSIFIDLDIRGEEYNPKEGKTDFRAWKREMSALLARARMIADAIIEADAEDYFRVVLSGHKGLHLYLDFEPIHPGNGTFKQFKAGLSQYGDLVMDWLDDTAGGVNIDPWVDVDASDLGRLARHPNTPHHGAVYDDEQRWAVPVSVAELAEMDYTRYLELTDSPRPIDVIEDRTPSQKATARVAQLIREADVSGRSHSNGTSRFDPSRLDNYDDQANSDIELDDIPFLTTDKPCIMAFRERDDAYEHGEASRTMELSIMARFIEMGVPRDVIHEFFEVIPGYDEGWTDEELDDLIGREYKEFNCETITDRASRFCIGDVSDEPRPDEGCNVYRRNSDLNK